MSPPRFLSIPFLLLIISQATKTAAQGPRNQNQQNQQDANLNIGDFNLLIILVVIGSAGVLLSGLASYLYFRILRTRRRQIMIAMAQREGQIDPENPPLSAENLDGRFPKIDFEKIENNTLAQTTCSVCLDDMQIGTSCRQLYCNHIFHAECIQLWLVNRIEKGQAVSCPNCNRDVSLIPKNEQPGIEPENPQGIIIANV